MNEKIAKDGDKVPLPYNTIQRRRQATPTLLLQSKQPSITNMSGQLRPPCRIDQLSFPLFAVDWFAEAGEDGSFTSWVAYCGGGGSAKTGVRNNIVIMHNEDLPFQISTGDVAGCSLKIYQEPASRRVSMLVALGTTVRRYSLTPQCELTGEVDVGEKCEHLAVSPNADQFAIGVGDEGRFKVFAMTEQDFCTPRSLLHLCQHHKKALTSMAYSPNGDRIVSASRDATAIVWKGGKVFGGMKCSIPEPKAGTKGRPQQVLVRGCAFGDKDGKYVITVHSGRKSEAFISIWKLNKENKYKCLEKSLCSKLPATALSISMDKKLLAIGVADGSVILWNKEEWRPIKTFSGVHELPVTCIAARPLPYPFVGEQVMMHVRTGSLDCNTGLLTLETRDPKKKPVALNDGGSGFCGWLVFLIFWILTVGLISMALTSMFPHAQAICSSVNQSHGIEAAVLCIVEEVFYIHPSRLGVPLPPV